MKKLTALLIILILIISVFGSVTVLAGSASVSFDSTKPVAGKTITYKVSVTATASSIGVTSITCGGVFSGSSSTAWKDSSSGTNQKITATGSIKVKVSSGAKPGDVGTIKVQYQVSTFDGTSVSTYSGSQSKNYTVVTASTTTSTVKTATTKTASSKPSATSSPGVWDIAQQNISNTVQGGSLNANITNDTLMPAPFISALKAKQCVFTANLGTYICTIDGSKLNGISGSGGVDLSLKMDKDETLSKIVNGLDVYQLHFKEQQLPGIFTFSFKADKSNPGDMLYLYCYYSEPGIIEGVESASVGTDGNVSFSIYHCSNYIVTASPVPNALGVSFQTAAAVVQPEQTEQDNQTELESSLKSANDETSALKTQLQSSVSQLEAAQTELNAEKELRAQSLSIPTVSLIVALCGSAVLAVFLTMLFCRIGIFRKKSVNKNKEHRFEM
jgi:hypothetical protein